MRIICVAGADRTGKSTLTEEFTKHGWEYTHFSPPKGSPYGEYRDFLDNVLKDPANKNRNFIVDRYMYCEFPYSKHYGRQSDMTVDRMHKIEREMLKLDPNAAVIYCETDLASNWERICREGKNEFKSIWELADLRDTYKEILSKSLLKVVKYDFSQCDSPEVFFKKINYIG